MGYVCGHCNSHRIRSLWAPPSNPPRLLWPRGMLSVTWTPSSTRCWRGHGSGRHPADALGAEAGADRGGAAQGDHGDLVRVLLRHAVAGDWPAVRHSVRHAVHAVCSMDPARAVAPAAQPLDPGLAAGLRRYCRSHCCHPRQPLMSFSADLLRPRLRWRQEDQGIHLAVDKYGFPLAINVSPANRHDSKGIIPVLHQLAGFKGTALGDLSYRGQRLSKRRLASPSNPVLAVMAEPSFRRGFASSARWPGSAATVG
jgi:hypothetical protein